MMPVKISSTGLYIQRWMVCASSPVTSFTRREALPVGVITIGCPISRAITRKSVVLPVPAKPTMKPTAGPSFFIVRRTTSIACSWPAVSWKGSGSVYAGSDVHIRNPFHLTVHLHRLRRHQLAVDTDRLRPLQPAPHEHRARLDRDVRDPALHDLDHHLGLTLGSGGGTLLRHLRDHLVVHEDDRPAAVERALRNRVALAGYVPERILGPGSSQALEVVVGE